MQNIKLVVIIGLLGTIASGVSYFVAQDIAEKKAADERRLELCSKGDKYHSFGSTGDCKEGKYKKAYDDFIKAEQERKEKARYKYRFKRRY